MKGGAAIGVHIETMGEKVEQVEAKAKEAAARGWRKYDGAS